MEKNYLQELINEGLSIRKIAEKIKKSESCVKYWLKKNGLKTKAFTIKKDDFICSRCYKQCKEDDFYKNKRKRHTYCKPCYNICVVDRQKLNKEKAVEYKGGCCEKCGYNKYIGALQFHHIDPKEKDPNWERFKNRKFDDKFKNELNKCMLLCANCHAEIHYELQI